MQDLARNLCISKQALENKMNGLHEFNLKEIEFLLKEFNDCTFEYLFQFK